MRWSGLQRASVARYWRGLSFLGKALSRGLVGVFTPLVIGRGPDCRSNDVNLSTDNKTKFAASSATNHQRDNTDFTAREVSVEWALNATTKVGYYLIAMNASLVCQFLLSLTRSSEKS